MGFLFQFPFAVVHVFLLLPCSSTAVLDAVTPTQPLIDSDGQTLVSKDGTFELGFFTPGPSSNRNRYLGIWYRNIPVRRVVWVANRDTPATDSGSSLSVDTGNRSLVIVSSNKSVTLWSSNATASSNHLVTSLVAELLNTGNLVLRDQNDTSNSEEFLWQSFDYPCDTLLPGMKLGWDSKSGLNRGLTSWKSPDDPSTGDFRWGIQVQNNPEEFMWKGSERFHRSGPWNGLGRSGAPELRDNPVFSYKFVWNEDEVYYQYELKNKSLISIVVMNQTSYLRQRLAWNEGSQSWGLYASVPRDRCDNYATCGAYATCMVSESPICECMKGFKSKSPEMWEMAEWSQGCVREKPNNAEGFVRYSELKLPDATHSWVNKTMSLGECRNKCLQNCSCTAYANTDIRGAGSGCSIWFADLIDMKMFSTGGQEIYIRMPASELGMYSRVKEQGDSNICRKEDLELPLIDLHKIVDATANFSDSNKLGEGGFGPVYKGVMADGQEVAVKRLSSDSGQGLKEFKTEVILISKLQHRNLVKLLGCCIQGDEKMLIYEYMPHRSLDSFIFDKGRSRLLDWGKRFDIICGIARGLLYLHQDSRLRIIHRDLKASNVLLDRELKPKISDFGLARIFGGDNSEGNTKRVVGTYGYMAPEYAADGLFSVKSDVFSFGILVLEIISGKKSRGFYHSDESLNLIGYAWRMWNEGKALELMDSALDDQESPSARNLSQAMRCIHTGLLCVQHYAEDRPSMATVVVMLGGGDSCALPPPKEPGFFKDKEPFNMMVYSSSSKVESSSTNELSFTLPEGR
ncbi:unnamed protein product [Linum tenue]|uniref:Receptor-like serine/threonine-protein kinase n=1 Tax=Linum tenue TaxID=586396 RepID=A0AAV0GUS9_9ROSI|nr:unnamed protein product [Linum tenue]